jgi:hypothetical protein
MESHKTDRSPFVVAFVLVVGLAAQALGGPAAGLIGAAAAAVAGGVVAARLPHQQVN